VARLERREEGEEGGEGEGEIGMGFEEVKRADAEV
jgi:hypothetical protein